MALRYTINAIAYESGANPHFVVDMTVEADVNAGVYSTPLKRHIYSTKKDGTTKTLLEMREELDAQVLAFAIEVRTAKLMEAQLVNYIGQEFTVEP